MTVTWKLNKIISAGESENDSICLTGSKICIGRSLSNDVVWNFPGFSRYHAKFHFRNFLWFITNTSVNGILLNSCRLPRNVRVVLHDGDVITFLGLGVDANYKVSSVNEVEATHPENSVVKRVLGRKVAQEKCSESQLNRTSVMTKLDSSRIAWSAKLPPGLLQPSSTTNLNESQVISLVCEAYDKRIDDIHANQAVELEAQREMLKKLFEERQEQQEVKFKNQMVNDQQELVRLRKEVDDLRKLSQLEIQEKAKLCEQMSDFVREELVCVVCHEAVIEAVFTQCDHLFCAHCITQWMKTSSTCPMCRHRICHGEIQRSALTDKITGLFFRLLPPHMQDGRQRVVEERRGLGVASNGPITRAVARSASHRLNYTGSFFRI